MYTELDKHAGDISSYSKPTRKETAEVLGFIKGSIEIIPFEAFQDKAHEAIAISPHLKDVPYVALALKYDCMILTGDKGLKKRLPEKVLTPTEAVDRLLDKKEP
jgi:predicted nucleic acid-binding protein